MSITITPTLTLHTELCAGLSAEEATCRVQTALRMGDVGSRVAAFYLADLVDRRTFVGMGHPTFKDYAEVRLRQAESTLRHLITIGRALRELPVIDSYFANDELNFDQVRELVPIATPETDRAWAVWAKPKSGRAIARQRKRREKGDLPTAPERRRIHEPRQRLGGDANPTQFELWRLLRAKFEAQRGSPLSDLDLMIMLAQLGLRLRPDGSVPGWTPVNDTHYVLHARVRRGADGATELVTDGEDGEEVVLDARELLSLTARAQASVLEPRSCTDAAPQVELVADPENHGPLVPTDLRDPPTSPDLRKEVLTRDGYQCRSCGSKDNVTVHHRVWRSHGGKTARENLVSTCEPCHSLVHARFSIILGEPEGELRFLDRAGLPRERQAAHPIALPIVGVPSDSAPRIADEVDLDHLPAEVDGEWWARHEHLFAWNERQGDLVLTPGWARELDGRLDEVAVPPGVAATSEGLDALVGQSAVRDRLKAAIAATRQRGDPLGHLLLTGSPGLGKTTLAHAVAADLGAPLSTLQAPHVRTPEALVRVVTSLKSGEVLFIDELHALPPRAAEVLYQALDEGEMTLPVRERDGLRTRTLRVRLRPFTLIGATTDLEQLPRALRSRLREHRLAPYTVDELTGLLDRSARALDFTLTSGGAERLARASGDTPRRALMLLDSVRDEATIVGVTVADEALVERALTREGIDASGLDAVERAYLRELEQAGRPLGLRTLAMRLDVTTKALRTVHEPGLIRRGLVRITSNGRVLVGADRPAPTGSERHRAGLAGAHAPP